MPKPPLTFEQILELLEAAPARMTTMTSDLTATQLRTRPSADEWSANEVLAHLRACADVWGGCIARILAEDGLTLRAVDPRTWMTQTDYPDLEFEPSLAAFTEQRNELLTMLRPLSDEELARSATMTGSGRPIDRTVFSFAGRMAVHERPHLKQIERVAKSMREG